MIVASTAAKVLAKVQHSFAKMTLWTGEFATLCAGVCTHMCVCVRACVVRKRRGVFIFLVLKLIRVLLVVLGL